MSQTHCNLIYHLVFSAKERRPYLTPDIRSDVHRYLAGAIQGADGIPLNINGTDDHVHLLVKLSQNHALKNVLRDIKTNSSGWIHREYRDLSDFAWQAGYGAFTVSASQKDTVSDYIQTQEARHAKYSFKSEYLAMLKAHEVEYDERYIWD